MPLITKVVYDQPPVSKRAILENTTASTSACTTGSTTAHSTPNEARLWRIGKSLRAKRPGQGPWAPGFADQLPNRASGLDGKRGSVPWRTVGCPYTKQQSKYTYIEIS